MASQRKKSPPRDKAKAPEIEPIIEAIVHEEPNVDLLATGEIVLLPQLTHARQPQQIDREPLDMDTIIEGVARKIATTRDHYKCIMFTDLVGSAEYKRRLGHTKGYMRNRVFCDTCERAVERYQGTVVKRLGDGVMAVFEPAMDAVLAALLIKRSIERERKKLRKIIGPVHYRIGITCGYVKELPGKADDYIGHAMDKGSRIEGIARSNQVLIDEIVYGLIHTKIRDHSDDILIGRPHNVTLKGVGVSTLYEISPKEDGLVSSLGYVLRNLIP